MELITIIFVMFLGILSGIITGLIPGIHINMIATLILTNFFIIKNIYSLEEIIIFILSMGTTHSFLDFIPSIIFGIPDSDTSISVLPSHRMVLEGKAYEAIFLSSIGSLLGMIFAFLISPIIFFFLKIIYETIKNIIPYILILLLISLILSENNLNKKFWALIISLFSGSLGLLVLNSFFAKEPLLLLFSGVFGLSGLFFAFNSKSNLPHQLFNIDFKLSKEYFKALILGGFSSTICSISPGVGNAQAASISTFFLKNKDSDNSKLIIFMLSSINTINFILSFITFYLIDKARNGSVFVISQIVEEISLSDLLFYFLIVFIVSFIAFFLTLFLGKIIINKVFKLNFQILNTIIILFLLSLIFFMSGLFGILILITSTFLGILCVSLEIRRIHLMSVLLIPVIFNLI